MKWLVTTFLCLLTIPAIAEEKQILSLPSALYCGPYDPDFTGKELEEKYGEIPFLEGDGEVLSLDPTLSYKGDVRIYLDPKDFSYSVFIDIRNEITCLVITGEQVKPAQFGDGI